MNLSNCEQSCIELSNLHIPIITCSILAFSTHRPQRARWKPSWAETVVRVSCNMRPEGVEGSSMVLPAGRGRRAISVAMVMGENRFEVGQLENVLRNVRARTSTLCSIREMTKEARDTGYKGLLFGLLIRL